MESKNIELRRERGAWVLALRGEHDMTTAPALRRQLDRAFAAGSAVIVDLSDVEFLDSTVLANVVHGREEARRHPEHGFSVVAPPGSFARRLTDLVSLDKTVAIFDDRDAAIAEARAQEERPS
jgi:anti-sigma B factor antagonist